MKHLSHRTSRRTFWQCMTLAVAAFLVSPMIADAQEGSSSLKKLLFYSRSVTFEHSVVKRENGAPSFADRVMTELAKKYGFEVTCTKDGSVFDKDYEKYDAFFLYTTGDLTKPGGDKEPPMSEQGKKNLLDAVAAGKGFLGSHCASDTFHSPGNQALASEQIDPYIQMLGGEFIRHGRQQNATMRVTSKAFPGLDKAGAQFDMHEEWYSLKNFAPDMHVILVQETKGMQDADYDRPPYPATWARMHGKGRVFYTSMGHREDVWTNPVFESILIGGLKWAFKEVDTEIPGNLKEAAPEASVLPDLSRKR